MATTLLTIEELERMNQPDGVRYELDEGQLVETTSPNFVHNIVAGNVYAALRDFAKRTQRGGAFGADAPFLLRRDPDSLRGPDAAFILAPRSTSMNLLVNLEGAPDLAVEVVSPNDAAAQLRRKVSQYLDSGANTVWVLYPEGRIVDVHTAASSISLGPDATLTAPELLPGFSIAVSELFQLG